MRTIVQRSPCGEAMRLLDRALIGAALFMVMLLVGVQLARADIIAPPAETPSTVAYHFSSHPMIAGTVVTVNDHQMVVDTDQGERVTLEIDTRTMAPRDLAPGMVMRTEFVALEDCRFYAQRIMAVRGGMSPNRLQAYANTRDSRVATAGHVSASGDYRRESTASQASDESREMPQTMGEHSPGRMMTATPTTADYQFSTRPMVSGTVVTVNDHRMVVDTDQGQRVGLVMDSRTMVPGEVVPGMAMRAEFSQMKDGRYYAKRVSRDGRSVADREQAYAHTRDSALLMAASPSDCGFVSAVTGNTAMSAVERRGAVEETDVVVGQSAPVAVVESPETLPQTASKQPLVLLLGLITLGSAGLVAFARGFRMV